MFSQEKKFYDLVKILIVKSASTPSLKKIYYGNANAFISEV